jgi:hypothetical protein
MRRNNNNLLLIRIMIIGVVGGIEIVRVGDGDDGGFTYLCFV